MDTIATHPLFLGAARHFIDVPIAYGSVIELMDRHGVDTGVPMIVHGRIAGKFSEAAPADRTDHADAHLE